MKLSLLERIKRRYNQDGISGLCRQTTHKLRSKLFPVQLMSVSAELTNRCNLKCKFCFVDKFRGSGFMKWKLFKKIVDEASTLKLKTFGMNYGGESLLHPKFKKYLRYVMKYRNKGCFDHVNWVDNGMLFSPDISDLVVDLGVDSIGFSLEGFGDINDKERVGCNYELVKDNILYLLDRRGPNRKPEVRINTLNLGNDDKFIKFWMDRVERVSVSTVRDQDNRLLDRRFFQNGWFTPKHCWFPFNYMAVFWDGAVTGCCSDGYGRMNLGDANKQSLKEIWNGKPYRKLRKGFANALCKKCDFWKTEFIPAVEDVFNGSGEITYSQYWKHYRRKC